MAADNYQIAGGLNFGTVPSQNDYQSAYANALNLNQQNYANILAGYQGTLAAQQADQAPIQQGYNDLTGQVLGDIQNIDASQLQAIEDTYQQQSGQASQDLINRGLGNTTVAQSVQRGLQLDKAKAQIASANQMAQLQAGYRSQLGSQALNYANQAAMQNAAQRNAQLGFMERVSAPYPDASKYANAALQAQTLALARQAAGQGLRGQPLQQGSPPAGMNSGGGFAGLGGTSFSGGGGGTIQQGGGIPYQTNPYTQRGEYGVIRNPGVATSTNNNGGWETNPALAANGLNPDGTLIGGGQAAWGGGGEGPFADTNPYQIAGSGSVGSGNTQEDFYNAFMNGQVGGGGQQQASLGQPGIANSLYDSQGNPIAGVAGVAGVAGDGAPQQSTDLDTYNAWASNYSGGGGSFTSSSSGDFGGDGEPEEEDWNDY